MTANPIKRSLFALCTVFVILCTPATSVAAVDWPQEVEAPAGKVIVYQPQPESLEGNVLTGRAAISLELNNGEEPDFGAIWFRSRIETDRDAGTVLIRDRQYYRCTAGLTPPTKQVDKLRELLEATVPEALDSKSHWSASPPHWQESRAELQSQLELNTDPAGDRIS